MSAPPASIATANHPKLHWSPVDASWIVSGGLLLLAVLPHQVPAAGRAILQSWVGSLSFAGVAVWVATQKRVLGFAMLMFLAGVLLNGYLFESFSPVSSSSFTLQKDPVDQGNEQTTWFEETVLKMAPKAIQSRTTAPDLLFDRVTAEQRASRWFDERELGEHPKSIQERVEEESMD